MPVDHRASPGGPHDLEDVLGVAPLRRLRRLLDQRPDAVVAVGAATGELLWASQPGSSSLFGRELPEFQGRSGFDYVHPHEREVVRKKHQRAAAGEAIRYACKARSADGGWQPVSVVAWPVQTSSGQLIVSITVPRSGDTDDPG